MSFGDGGGFDGGDGFGDGGQDYGGDYGQDSGTQWADPYTSGMQAGLHQGAELSDRIAQALMPIHETVQSLRADADAATLLDQYPALADEQVAEQVVGLADQLAAQLGIPPERARSAEFISLVMQAQGQGGAGGQQGGYGQGAFNEQRDAEIGQAIVAAGGPRLNLW
jgi:hypothetical protein